MKNMSLALKIGIGFALLIFLTGVLGIMTLRDMANAEKNAARMDNEYVPEVVIANHLERNVLQTLNAMRGYGFTSDEKHYAEARKEMDEVRKYLAEAKALAEKYPDLVKLRDLTTVATAKFAEYEKLAGETKTLLEAEAKDRAERIKVATTSLGLVEQYQKSQDESMRLEVEKGVSKEELLERHQKLSLLTDLAETIADIRIKVLSGDVNDDLKLYEAAKGRFSQVESELLKLRAITHQAANQKLLDDIKASIESYKSMVDRQLVNTKSKIDLNKKRFDVGVEVQAMASQIAEAGISQLGKLAEESDQELDTAQMVLIAGLVCAIILGVVIAVLITRAITRPVRLGVDFAKTVAGGDYSKSLHIDQRTRSASWRSA